MENLRLGTNEKQSQPITLTLDQHRATELILMGRIEAEVAQLVGVEITTIEQWQKKPEFIAALNMLRVASSDSSALPEETERSEPITTLDVTRFL